MITKQSFIDWILDKTTDKILIPRTRDDAVSMEDGTSLRVKIANMISTLATKLSVTELSNNIGDLTTLTTTEKGSAVGAINEVRSSICNHNIGINCDFRKGHVINQRAQTTYNTNSPQYTIDMWKGWQEDILLTDSGIKLKCKTGISVGAFSSILDINKNLLIGKTCTLSIELDDGNILTSSGIISATNTSLVINNTEKGIEAGIVNDNNTLLITFYSRSESVYSSVISRVKLELGSISTLHLDPPPKPQAELAECQRYFINFVDEGDVNWGKAGTGVCLSATQAEIIVALPCAMRITPTIMQNLLTINDGNGSHNVSSVALTRLTGNQLEIVFNTTGLTVGNGCFLEWRQDLGGYLRLSSEL